jgi:hypothetical protein
MWPQTHDGLEELAERVGFALSRPASRRRTRRTFVKRRRRSARSRSKAHAPRETLDCLDVLTRDEASAVLRGLLSSHPELLPNARQLANALLATISFADLARGVRRDARSLLQVKEPLGAGMQIDRQAIVDSRSLRDVDLGGRWMPSNEIGHLRGDRSKNPLDHVGRKRPRR